MPQRHYETETDEHGPQRARMRVYLEALETNWEGGCVPDSPLALEGAAAIAILRELLDRWPDHPDT